MPLLSGVIGKTSIIRPAITLIAPEIVMSFFLPIFATMLEANGINAISGRYEAIIASVALPASLK